VLRSEVISYSDTGFELAGPSRRWLVYDSGLKRALDVALACIGLVLTLPIWLAVVVAIKLDSPGPAIFVQERVGRQGRPFRFYKFRSMQVNAEQRLAEVRHRNDVGGPVFKMRRDPRVSRVGAILRKTSLDELPQLINVVKGEMSLVGPRPPVQREVDHYRPEDMIRLSVRPGLTCLWQVRGRSNVGFDTWMEYDREYIRDLSLWLDLKILVQTVSAVISCRGAY
jgi:exopolysaccharide biosynthesis polyprenyl glycosylphosphotransferase